MSASLARKATSQPMRSEVNWAVLGLVIERPSYGLELYNRYQRVYGDVRPVSAPSHIYGALDALKARSLIEKTTGVSVRRQPRPCYRATKAGVHSYVEWLVEQVEAERKRQALWVRQLAIFTDTPAVALQILNRFEYQYLKRAGETGKRPEGLVRGSREELTEDLVAELQRISAGGILTWIRHTIGRFEALQRRPR